MENTTMTLQGTHVLSRAGIQDPSVLLGTRCVQGDLQVTRGQVRPHIGSDPAERAYRIRPTALGVSPSMGDVPFAGSVWPGGSRQT